MSIRVDLDDLHGQIARFGARAFLVTNAADGPPHVSSALVTIEGDDLAVGAGRTTHAKVAERAAVSLVWSIDTEREYCLIVDGILREGSPDHALVSPTSAVLHRLAE